MNMTATYETPWLNSYLVDETIPPAGPINLQPIENTQELLQEFNNVYNAVHYTNLVRPPCTNNAANFNQGEFIDNSGQYPTYNFEQQLPVPVIQHNNATFYNNNNDLQFMDEILRARCDQWITNEFDNSSSCASSAYSSALSPAASDLESSYNGSTGSNDEDFEYFGSRRMKPYDRESSDGGEGGKHFRKKDQNKNAARKYRQKKKQEVEEILVEEKQLTEIHDKLAKEYGEIKREVKYLKGLMRDLFKSKGVIE
ncbi:activating transcription factor of chaperone-like [Culicoides brevitarsis]|uniref:activating transcription factor of chaperone-like n=1 Tax=Culicoides brevitarsis TaxID=469753 RepID=UPI00307CB7D5